MDRRKFLSSVGAGIVLVSGCLGGDTPQSDGEQNSGGADSTKEPVKETSEPATNTTSTPESTPEPTPVPPEDRIDFERDDDDPEVVGTLLLKGDIPGVIVSSDFLSAKSWQNYATVDEKKGTYNVGLSVKTTSSIGRIEVVGQVYDEEGELISEDTDVTNNIAADEKALIHLVFEDDLEEMYYYEVQLIRPN
ncbi:hypothetical protein E6P09_16445 (plasmid) [Haloferax mediterranei ATCC 33500]|uniref:Uncharacterized protein n=1 Tax=Haloferax mediterranei (strain ATCC 33500 / DSM 1411 / JCM 8866 / NBRC 14739 / NCIMB 2177 / R-4) TaxID=523841 RepID=I3RB06_HALMT|nr:hypothetical protein [Haloferax mediterranei]AFK21416.1 hypothetical protein HFX_6294 [Haloferax mediterranei ATCC 33500]AHZ24514.1 hypothetical protein BM92_16525 [Haloferax mediterranei ATCC 33500]ELZ97266.1 hypothetical protein C439_18128 [Haloferax mediterranei ATCC 33500]MDX5990433.1 hypothetical protein [Haloferax mediterranei ATCC 33500]QCQ76910.1 hypothetical protein E6P09_16445 [Haloferax mediterranei ATCC 33500]